MPLYTRRKRIGGNYDGVWRKEKYLFGGTSGDAIDSSPLSHLAISPTSAQNSRNIPNSFPFFSVDDLRESKCLNQVSFRPLLLSRPQPFFQHSPVSVLCLATTEGGGGEGESRRYKTVWREEERIDTFCKILQETKSSFLVQKKDLANSYPGEKNLISISSDLPWTVAMTITLDTGIGGRGKKKKTRRDLGRR